MKNLHPDEGDEVFGERTGRDLTSQLKKKIDGMFDDELEEAVVALKDGILRLSNSAIRRALEHRDGGCTWAGCDAHHIIHWANGGETALHNLILICRRHHTATHNGKQPPEP
ncbi:MAG: HNH endonuclease signature motif containing protein [Actinomycetota bacterium]